MESSFPSVAVKEEPSSDGETSEVANCNREQAEPMNYANADRHFYTSSMAGRINKDDGHHGATTSWGTMDNLYGAEHESETDCSTDDMHDDVNSDIEDNDDVQSQSKSDMLFQYDEESDPEDEKPTPGPNTKTSNNDKQITWTQELCFTKLGQFRAPVGTNLAGNKDSVKEVDFFHRFFPVDLYKEAQMETNNFAEYYREKKRDLGRDWWEWIDSTWMPVESKDEMTTFIGICIIMAVQSLPNPRDYWSRRKYISNTLITKSGMSMERFDRIMNYFYLSNPWRDPEKIANPERRVEACTRNPLYKVNKGLHEHVKMNCIALYEPHQDMALQELTGGFEGHTNSWKLLALRDASTGYVSNFEWYREPGVKKESSDQRMSCDLATRNLTKDLSGKGHCVYADNVFVSPSTALQIMNQNTHITTDCSNWPKDITRFGHDSDVGSTVSVQFNGVTATAWQGKRVKYSLSTMHDGSTQPVTVKLRDPLTREHTVKNAPCPSALAKHTVVLEGVPDRLLLSRGPVLQKLTNSWWKRLVWLLIDICLGNAYVMWTASTRKRRSYTEFSMVVASGLINYSKMERPRKDSGKMPVTTQEALNQQSVQAPPQPMLIAFPGQNPDFPNNLIPPGGPSVAVDPQSISSLVNLELEALEENVEHSLIKFHGRGRSCRQCIQERVRTKSGRRRDTQFGCNVCDLNLCRSGCFVRYHETRGLKVTDFSRAEIIVPAQIQPAPPKKLKYGL